MDDPITVNATCNKYWVKLIEIEKPPYVLLYFNFEITDLSPYSNLTLIPEWKQMVAKLILMSYKLSAVVSPVVQSSSPEGLIPMDTDSGNLAWMFLKAFRGNDRIASSSNPVPLAMFFF